VVIVDCKQHKIKAISFNGFIAIHPNELWEVFKNYRKGYSLRDDLNFYFFNEDKKNGNYTLSFFLPSLKEFNIQESDEHLSNLTLSWG
jgi:hypothetical protein